MKNAHDNFPVQWIPNWENENPERMKLYLGWGQGSLENKAVPKAINEPTHPSHIRYSSVTKLYATCFRATGHQNGIHYLDGITPFPGKWWAAPADELYMDSWPDWTHLWLLQGIYQKSEQATHNLTASLEEWKWDWSPWQWFERHQGDSLNECMGSWADTFMAPWWFFVITFWHCLNRFWPIRSAVNRITWHLVSGLNQCIGVWHLISKEDCRGA